MTHLSPDTRLTRKRAAEELTRHGYPISKKTLATLAVRGGGPLFRHFGRLTIYEWSDLVGWAEARCSPRYRNTSEAIAALKHP